MHTGWYSTKQGQKSAIPDKGKLPDRRPGNPQVMDRVLLRIIQPQGHMGSGSPERPSSHKHQQPSHPLGRSESNCGLVKEGEINRYRHSGGAALSMWRGHGQCPTNNLQQNMADKRVVHTMEKKKGNLQQYQNYCLISLICLQANSC